MCWGVESVQKCWERCEKLGVLECGGNVGKVCWSVRGVEKC